MIQKLQNIPKSRLLANLKNFGQLLGLSIFDRVEVYI